MVKHMIMAGVLLGVLGTVMPAIAREIPEEPAARPGKKALQPQREKREMTPEELEVHRRRYEIMVLMQAYRLLPEEQKELLREEIMVRLRADYQVNRARLEKTIARMEEELARLKSRLDERTPEELVAAEFERLENMPIGGLGPMGWMGPKPGGPPGGNGNCPTRDEASVLPPLPPDGLPPLPEEEPFFSGPREHGRERGPGRERPVAAGDELSEEAGPAAR